MRASSEAFLVRDSKEEDQWAAPLGASTRMAKTKTEWPSTNWESMGMAPEMVKSGSYFGQRSMGEGEFYVLEANELFLQNRSMSHGSMILKLKLISQCLLDVSLFCGILLPWPCELGCDWWSFFHESMFLLEFVALCCNLASLDDLRSFVMGLWPLWLGFMPLNPNNFFFCLFVSPLEGWLTCAHLCLPGFVIVLVCSFKCIKGACSWIDFSSSPLLSHGLFSGATIGVNQICLFSAAAIGVIQFSVVF
ncbi:uncharacterized protein LOC114738314 [Neltuma alba]|uniref:uncharacterized protein LOC114738314 n=1 Tax=Neltuma alba TaxID=207710 RepID=UPI0010A3C830|nr:uncharacterized protein LOC114738314 [Prosopis alba]